MRTLFFLVGIAILHMQGIAQKDSITAYVNGGRLDRRSIEAMLREVGVPGMSLAIIKNNKVVFARGYGYKKAGSRDRVGKHTVFEAASLSKSFLVYVTHLLVDEGRFDLDKPMYQYLDPGPLLNYDSRYKLITPRMILSHSSGLENWRQENDPTKLEIVSDPGTKYVYSGEGYTYLSAVLETVLKRSYEDYVRDMVIKPLHLKDVYLLFDTVKGTPRNYAIGHDQFGKPMRKWKHTNPVPAGGVNLTAKAYAKLIISIFDKKHLSPGRVADIEKPIISLREAYPFHWFGAGFEVLYSGGDTIISHGGSNPGFKNLLFYSTVSKNGFVLLTNGDRGKWMASRIDAMTAALDISPIFKGLYYDQYPSEAITLFRMFNEGRKTEMVDRIDELSAKGALGVNTLDELGDVLSGTDSALAGRLLRMNIRLYPESPTAYNLLGKLDMEEKQFAEAVENFTKAKELHVQDENLEARLRTCEQQIAKLNQQ